MQRSSYAYVTQIHTYIVYTVYTDIIEKLAIKSVEFLDL